MSDSTISTVSKYLAVATPIIVVDSADHPDTIRRLLPALADKSRPAIRWDCANGFVPIGEPGESALRELSDADVKLAGQGMAPALHVALKLPAQTILIVDNAHWQWEKPPALQALQNLREPFKSSKRAVVLLANGGSIPADLSQHASYVADPLPDETALAETVRRIHDSALDSELPESDALEIGRELRGASPFRAEQLAAQSLTRGGFDRQRVRDNARKQINDTPGLAVETGIETFDDIGGLNAIREYLERYFSGPRRPDVVVRIEEIEKALAGVSGDTSGTSGDILGTLLTSMEDYRWSGILAYGVSGCGKSLIAKSAANQFGARAIRFDVNACKGSLVGQTGEQIRRACDVLHAIGGERVFFVASMNRIEALPPELRRRFAGGTWYFDVPDETGRADIWRICADRFGVEYDGYDAANLTGADIRDIVSRQWELSTTTAEAARFHVPLCKAAPDAIADSRADARGRYLCANVGGPYADRADVSGEYDRSISLED